MIIKKLITCASLSQVKSPYDRTWEFRGGEVKAIVENDSPSLIEEIRQLTTTIELSPLLHLKTRELTRAWCNCSNTYWLICYTPIPKDVKDLGDLTPTFTMLCEHYKITSEVDINGLHWLLLGSAESPPN